MEHWPSEKELGMKPGEVVEQGLIWALRGQVLSEKWTHRPHQLTRNLTRANSPSICDCTCETMAPEMFKAQKMTPRDLGCGSPN